MLSLPAHAPCPVSKSRLTPNPANQLISCNQGRYRTSLNCGRPVISGKRSLAHLAASLSCCCDSAAISLLAASMSESTCSIAARIAALEGRFSSTLSSTCCGGPLVADESAGVATARPAAAAVGDLRSHTHSLLPQSKLHSTKRDWIHGQPPPVSPLKLASSDHA